VKNLRAGHIRMCDMSVLASRMLNLEPRPAALPCCCPITCRAACLLLCASRLAQPLAERGAERPAGLGQGAGRSRAAAQHVSGIACLQEMQQS
jgi:hypothetical protein